MACVQDPSLTGAGSQNFQLSQKSKRSLRPIIPQRTLFSTDTPIYSAASLLFKNWKYVDDGVGNEEEWITLRRYLQIFFGSAAYDWILTLLLLLNVAIVVMEVDADARHEAPTSFVTSLSTAGSVIWLFEMVLRVWVFRLAMFRRLASLAEFLIVMVDCSVTFLGHTSAVAVLRVFRLTRLVRALRFVHLFPELHLMMKGLAGAFSVGLWGSIFLAFAILVWSIVFVVVVHPYNKVLDYGDCDRCPQAFGSVGAAFLTFAQSIVAGDSWGMVAVPLIEAHPWTALLFAGVWFTVAQTLMNLILAVICDGAERARQLGDREASERKKQEVDNLRIQLKALCERIDSDGSGELTEQEFMDEYDKDGDFQAMLTMLDIQRDELQALCKIMDRDSSGSVDHEEFVEQMILVKGQDTNTLLYFMKHYITECYMKLVEAEHHAERRHKHVHNLFTSEATQQDFTSESMPNESRNATWLSTVTQKKRNPFVNEATQPGLSILASEAVKLELREPMNAAADVRHQLPPDVELEQNPNRDAEFAQSLGREAGVVGEAEEMPGWIKRLMDSAEEHSRQLERLLAQGTGRLDASAGWDRPTNGCGVQCGEGAKANAR